MKEEEKERKEREEDEDEKEILEEEGPMRDHHHNQLHLNFFIIFTNQGEFLDSLALGENPWFGNLGFLCGLL